ncbi:hypothetical protein HDZ31DRAFT_3144, partial [Schizophyllum fasciatum]
VLQLTEGLRAIGARHGAMAGQTALAWVLAQGPNVNPNPGTTKVKYMIKNLGALDLELS